MSSFVNNFIPTGIDDSLPESKIFNNDYKEEISLTNIPNNDNTEMDSTIKNNFDFTPNNIS